MADKRKTSRFLTGLGQNFTFSCALHGILDLMERYTVTVRWDAEANVWYVADSDVPGLATEGETLEEIEQKLAVMIPELLELNDPAYQPHRVPFELIAHKQELSA